MKGIMIQGTSSDVGKSYITTAICRMLSNKGYNVAPFKSQNLSNNSYVTIDGLEMGRAQGAQAEASRVLPDVYMNPILLKPQTNKCEVILNGSVFESFEGFDYRKKFTLTKGIEAIKSALHTHQSKHDIIVIEGAGSPAEVNLNDREIVNMRVAELADVDVILVVDIDKGGSFASVVGTLELVFEHRHRIKGILFNKFRGNLALLQDGLDWLEDYTGVKVLGVIPYLDDVYVETEDAQSIIQFQNNPSNLDIGVIQLERVSNNTDIEPFIHEKDVSVRLIHSVDEFNKPDALIIPGTKSTIDDLHVLKNKGLDQSIIHYIKQGGIVMGICGGYQMLGNTIIDEDNVDTKTMSSTSGLGIFNIDTIFHTSKHVNQVTASYKDQILEGYEIHLGKTIYHDSNYFATINNEKDGSTTQNNQVIGTYLHGIFHNDPFRNEWLNQVRIHANKPPLPIVDTKTKKEESFEKLAKVFENSIDIEYFMSLIQS